MSKTRIPSATNQDTKHAPKEPGFVLKLETCSLMHLLTERFLLFLSFSMSNTSEKPPHLLVFFNFQVTRHDILIIYIMGIERTHW